VKCEEMDARSEPQRMLIGREEGVVSY